MTEEDVAKIRRGHWASDQAAADELGVRLKSVNFARRGITFKWLKEPAPHATRRAPCNDPYRHRSVGRVGGG